MRFKVDESLHVEVADLLRGQDHDALTAFDQGLRGRDGHDLASALKTKMERNEANSVDYQGGFHRIYKKSY
jgi:hypothetical protein